MRVCDFFFFLEGLFLDGKKQFAPHRLKLMQCFTFRWLTNRLGGGKGGRWFTACFLLAVSWLGVLWWMWLLSMLLSLSRDHCVFRGRVRGGAAGNLALNSEVIWEFSSNATPPLVHWPAESLQSLSSCCPKNSFLICWCVWLCCWYNAVDSPWCLVSIVFSLTTSVADSGTALSSSLLPDSQEDFVICTSPAAPKTPLSGWLCVWGFKSLFSLFIDFFDLCGLRGTIFVTSVCEFPVLLQSFSPTGLGSFIFQASLCLEALPFGTESQATGVSKFLGLSRCSKWPCLKSFFSSLACFSGGDSYPFSWMALRIWTDSWCPLAATVPAMGFISLSPAAINSVSRFGDVPCRLLPESGRVWQLFIFASVQDVTANVSLPSEEVLLFST